LEEHELGKVLQYFHDGTARVTTWEIPLHKNLSELGSTGPNYSRMHMLVLVSVQYVSDAPEKHEGKQCHCTLL